MFAPCLFTLYPINTTPKMILWCCVDRINRNKHWLNNYNVTILPWYMLAVLLELQCLCCHQSQNGQITEPRACLQLAVKSVTKYKYLLTYLITYLLTPWCRVLLEKLTGLQPVKKFPTFHGTRRFITALTSVCHLSLSSVHFIPSNTKKRLRCDVNDI